jgi:hypothetical protein
VLGAGDGGNGKSSLTLHLAAKTSIAKPCFGLKYDPPEASDTLLISCEDDFGDTVVPRLLAAGADLDRVHRVDGVQTKDGKPAPFNLAYYQALENELRKRPAVKLVVIDPAGAYIGRAGVDDHKDSDLRALLSPLAELAARGQVTVFLVKHLVKGATGRAVHKVSGSAGYVNSVRAAFVIAPDPEDQDRKLFLPLKFNIATMPPGRAFRLEELAEFDKDAIVNRFDHLEERDREMLAGQLFAVEWEEGQVDADADDILCEAARQGRNTGKVQEAAEWLDGLLAKYAYPSREIMTKGAEEGFTKDNLYRAKKLRDGTIRASNKRFQGEWLWGIGDPENWTIRPEATE